MQKEKAQTISCNLKNKYSNAFIRNNKRQLHEHRAGSDEDKTIKRGEGGGFPGGWGFFFPPLFFFQSRARQRDDVESHSTGALGVEFA